MGSVKYRFIEFFVFDYDSLPYILALFFWLGVPFPLVALDKIFFLPSSIFPFLVSFFPSFPVASFFPLFIYFHFTFPTSFSSLSLPFLPPFFLSSLLHFFLLSFPPSPSFFPLLLFTSTPSFLPSFSSSSSSLPICSVILESFVIQLDVISIVMRAVIKAFVYIAESCSSYCCNVFHLLFCILGLDVCVHYAA